MSLEQRLRQLQGRDRQDNEPAEVTRLFDYERSCVYALVQAGQTDVRIASTYLGPPDLPTEERRKHYMPVWFAEALLSSITAMRAGAWDMALRCYLQATEYRETCGWLHAYLNPYLHDVWRGLREYFERRLTREG